jgi:hypothetical protein
VEITLPGILIFPGPVFSRFLKFIGEIDSAGSPFFRIPLALNLYIRVIHIGEYRCLRRLPGQALRLANVLRESSNMGIAIHIHTADVDMCGSYFGVDSLVVVSPPKLAAK